MTDEKNLISLKEAAKISGYSSDYIGQLIRAGKIPGKQVYTNVSWMTTADAVIEYKDGAEKNKNKKEDKNLGSYLKSRKQKFLIEMDIFKLFFQTFKSFLPTFIIALLSFLLLAAYLFHYIFDENFRSSSDNLKNNKNTQVLF